MLSKCAAAIPAWNESRSTFLPFISTNITPFLVLVARTGIEPVVSALRGRRVKPITLPGHFGHSIALQCLWAISRKIMPGFRNVGCRSDGDAQTIHKAFTVIFLILCIRSLD